MKMISNKCNMFHNIVPDRSTFESSFVFRWISFDYNILKESDKEREEKMDENQERIGLTDI